MCTRIKIGDVMLSGHIGNGTRQGICIIGATFEDVSKATLLNDGRRADQHNIRGFLVSTRIRCLYHFDHFANCQSNLGCIHAKAMLQIIGTQHNHNHINRAMCFQ